MDCKWKEDSYVHGKTRLADDQSSVAEVQKDDVERPRQSHRCPKG